MCQVSLELKEVQMGTRDLKLNKGDSGIKMVFLSNERRTITTRDLYFLKQLANINISGSAAPILVLCQQAVVTAM